ncbi:metal-dependent hydrolase [Anaerosalibacter bizertensis]|uniref:Metal-dependent hydrolase n=1 Tax=Anaerosalibacter bizertensis TaxID=932217 RepID=A0A9Q4ABB4_9FIRM|nr:metal-dependent hydrolase [Anaerosalibacter bizertensis]MCB5560326.1 metal-dependent hydrolase [Anaerosalibacter bizertensis]MCG4564537.1 metal-dependent hydrolase [Anaerosalibacter bizertensis]MCG4584024.1 metal-dependent hydrolase [Anaerosalibacter bizertensis]
MTGKTHVAVGVATGLALSTGKPIKEQFFLIITSAIGAVIPDLDHPKSKLNQKILIFNNKFFKALFYVFIGIGFIYLDSIVENQEFKILGIIMILTGMSSHRGFTHSLLGFLLFSSIAYTYSIKFGINEIYLGFNIGYVLHLVMDFFTPKGIQLFFPITKNISSPITIKTNGEGENLLFIGSSFYSLYFLIQFIR